MRILTRYVLCEFLKVFLLALTGLTGVVILAFLAREAVEQGLGPATILRLIPYIVPQALQFAIPGTVLLAATSVYGRLAGGNEIVAIKSAGVSPMAAIWPTLTLVAVVSMAAVWLNDVAFSWGRSGVESVLLNSIEEIVYGQLEHQQSFEQEGISITVDRVEGKRLIRPQFTLHRPGKTSTILRAEAAELEGDAANGVRVTLYDPYSEGNVGVNFAMPGEHPFSFKLSDYFGGKAAASDDASQMPLAEVPRATARHAALIDDLRQELATLTGFSLVGGDFRELVGEEWTSRTRQIEHSQGMLARLRTEPHRRWASGFSCLAFVLVGIPMAIRRRHAEFLASFFACFLPILLLYYPMLVVGLRHAKDGELPPIAVWTGNVVFALWGIWLLRRVVRY